MKGFAPQYSDLPDYILKCTAMIWEGRNIAALDWHYSDDLLVRTPAGISQGNAAGKANTMATLSEFPDRQLLGEDVIWCGDEDNGFLSSHRIVSTATHQGGEFGRATGKHITFRTIADTFCLNNRVWDEWLIRDNAAIAVQLGQSAKSAARASIERAVLNPVRAGMVKNPEDWHSSSFHAMIGLSMGPIWLNSDWLLSAFVDRSGSAKKR